MPTRRHRIHEPWYDTFHNYANNLRLLSFRNEPILGTLKTQRRPITSISGAPQDYLTGLLSYFIFISILIKWSLPENNLNIS